MKNKPIQITDADVQRLRKMLDQAIQEGEITIIDGAKLRTELDRAKVVGSHTGTAGVVTMNSTVELLDLETGEEETYTLVFPGEADLSVGKVSVLAPIGTAMLGYRAGDSFEWEVPSGTRRLAIRQIVSSPNRQEQSSR
jgi:regulator of nucleoside diphosphate kinase